MDYNPTANYMYPYRLLKLCELSQRPDLHEWNLGNLSNQVFFSQLGMPLYITAPISTMLVPNFCVITFPLRRDYDKGEYTSYREIRLDQYLKVSSFSLDVVRSSSSLTLTFCTCPYIQLHGHQCYWRRPAPCYSWLLKQMKEEDEEREKAEVMINEAAVNQTRRKRIGKRCRSSLRVCF